MRWTDYVEERPDVMMGKAVFKGTRVTVEHVLAELGNGVPQEELLRGHARLTPDHIKAALLYAAAVIGLQESVYE